MANPHANPNNPLRKCSRCPTMHRRKHNYCETCYREWKRERIGSDVGWVEPGTPPPPPPGFNERDLRAGRPYE